MHAFPCMQFCFQDTGREYLYREAPTLYFGAIGRDLFFVLPLFLHLCVFPAVLEVGGVLFARGIESRSKNCSALPPQ